jgi:hypothetical protein
MTEFTVRTFNRKGALAPNTKACTKKSSLSTGF